MIPLDQIVQGDCIDLLRSVEPFADLVFADPPFNIGYKYDVYEDRKAYDEYYRWTRDWMTACKRILKPTGSFWIAIGAEYAAEVRFIGRELGLTLRNWVIWHYTFGQNTKRKFARSHTHLFYFTMHPTEFTFNDKAVRTFSDREREYNDKRANPDGRIPDDVWTEFPRVCGTFGQREGWHPCQMPEPLLARIVRVCSNPGDVVFDPFSGSGTTAAAAKRLDRRYAGTEISAEYVKNANARLAEIQTLRETAAKNNGRWSEEMLDLLNGAYAEFALPTDRLYANPHLFTRFVERFHHRLRHSGVEGEYSSEEIWRQLEMLRKSVRLVKIRAHADEPASLPIRATPEYETEPPSKKTGRKDKTGLSTLFS
ncbi:MAG: site-specific DNA-methyltransferase [Phycisphaerae bacterium]|nr:site-specific DNA-methyltransferase [Phycisphaerae bacterium]